MTSKICIVSLGPLTRDIWNYPMEAMNGGKSQLFDAGGVNFADAYNRPAVVAGEHF